MDNNDVLRHVIARMDNTTLSNLARTPLWIRIVPLIDNYFWYLRSQAIVHMELQPRTETAWNHVYYTLLNANGGRETFDWNNVAPDRSQVDPLETGVRRALGYLPSLLVLIEVYGPPKWSDKTLYFLWSYVASPDVFDYLLASGIALDSQRAMRAIHINMNREDSAMVSRLLDWLSPTLGEDGGSARRDLQDALEDAILSGFLEGVKLLDRWGLFTRDMYKSVAGDSTSEVLAYLLEAHPEDGVFLAELAVWTYEKDDAGMLAVLLDHGADPDMIVDDWQQFLNGGHVRVLDLLVGRGLGVVTEEEWTDMLREAVELNESSGVTAALKHVPPSKIKNKTDLIGRLRSAGGPIANDIVFDKIRSETAMSPLLQQLDSNTKLAQQLAAESDPMTWTTETVRVFSWALKIATDDRVAGFRRAQDTLLHRQSIGPVIERRNIYSLLLRFILFRKPTSVELLDWMIARDDRDLELAAKSMILDKPLQGQDKNAISLRALMLVLLYPTLTLKRLIERLGDEKASSDQLAFSAGIVGAYLGAASARLK